MGRRKIKRKRKIRGKGKPYVYQNRIYFGKRPQTCEGVVSTVLANLLKKCWYKGCHIFGTALKNFGTCWHPGLGRR